MNDLIPAGESPSLGRLVAALTGDAADLPSLTRVLTVTLAEVLPIGMVDVEYDRSLADRMSGRPGTPVALTVTTGDRVLTLQAGRAGRTEAVVARAVRGVTISRSPVSIVEWIAALAEQLNRLANEDASARSAIERLLLG
jgi:hypothetical protein